MNEPLSSELMARYLASEASAEERTAVETWAAADPANAAELDRMRTLWKAKGAPRKWNADRAWTKVAPKLDGASSTPVVPIRRRWHALPAVRIAAAAVLVVGLGFALKTYGPGTRLPSQIYTTKVGERQTVDLADGTRVTIGPMSELRVAAKYNGRERRVDLTGEAWFEVKHDTTRSFRVHALGTITEDLGTSFSVRALESDSTVRVIVVEGSASVRLEEATIEQGATLNAKDMVDLDARTLKAQIVRNVDVEPLVSWRTGQVSFTDASLGDVAVELERWYGVSMRFERPALARRPVSYNMPTNNLDEALVVLRASLAVSIERKGDTLFVR